jgi:ubiquinone/menaquinone biosynthesis C-methylase UbiE
VPDREHQAKIRSEFDSAAPVFAERSRSRYDAIDVVGFSQVATGATVLEVGSGTSNFLRLFDDVAGACIGIDLSFGMLAEARRLYPHHLLVQGEGESLPLGSGSIALATCAQMLHHVWDPLPLVKELRRVAGKEGKVLVVDQIATERFEEATRMSQLETVRDPSHAMSRPRSGYLTMIRAAGLKVVAEHVHEDRSSLSKWMWPEEFDSERIDATRAFIAQHGHETGMEFEKEGDDYTFTRRRLMILAERA